MSDFLNHQLKQKYGKNYRIENKDDEFYLFDDDFFLTLPLLIKKTIEEITDYLESIKNDK